MRVGGAVSVPSPTSSDKDSAPASSLTMPSASALPTSCFSDFSRTGAWWQQRVSQENVPYQSQDDLDNTIYEILQEAQSTADSYNCFIEADVTALDGLERSW